MSRYSFDVPNPCINFATLSDDDVHNADSWFDQQANLENIPPAENLAKVLQNSPAFSKPALVLSSVTSQGMTKSENCEEDEAEVSETDVVPQNTVGSLTSWRATAPAEAPQRAGRRPATKQRKTQQRKQPARVRVEKNDTTLANKEEAPPLKKMKISSSKEKLTDVSPKKELLHHPDLSPARGKNKLTVPSTPTMLKRTTYEESCWSSNEAS